MLFRNSQVGTEISWPLYNASEDYIEKYYALAETFNPAAFNPAAWARLAKLAGMGGRADDGDVLSFPRLLGGPGRRFAGQAPCPYGGKRETHPGAPRRRLKGPWGPGLLDFRLVSLVLFLVMIGLYVLFG